MLFTSVATRSRPRRRKAALPLLIAASLLLAACGQKGPLVLPKPPAAASAPAR